VPVTINEGLVDDSDILQNERMIDMDREIAMLDKDVSQFTTMLMRVAKKKAISSKVEWLEDQLFPRLSALSASITAASATMPVTAGEGAYFRVGDVIRIPVSGEAVAVSAAPAADVVGITRSVGSVAAATAASGAELVIIGNASAQGASLGVRKVTERVAQYNYCQIFRHPYGFTETLAASELYGGNEPMKERRKKGIEHKRAIEYSLFLGARDHDTGGSEPKDYMGGLFEFITTNVKDPSGAMDKAEFETFMRAFLAKGDLDGKVLFASPLVAQIISGYPRDNWVKSTPSQRLWGVKVNAFVSGAFGSEVPVVVKRDWDDFSSASSQYGGWAFSVDFGSLQFRPLRTTRLLLGRQGNSEDQQVEEYLTEVSLQVEQERHHGIIKNATS
jgi:hypothetical protein